MKRIVVAVCVSVAVLSLAQCELFRRTVQYAVTGDSASITVLYQTKSTELTEVVTASPWNSEELMLYAGDRPFLAYIEVTNNGANDVTAQVLNDGEVEESITVPAGAGGHVHPVIP